MSSIIIDGYNLIGAYHKDIGRQRDMLIGALIEYRRRKGHDMTVVFDGWKTGEGQESQAVTGGVRVIYSRIGENADSVIKRIVTSVRREWIVVSSDRDIADHAWASGSIPVRAEDFLRALEKTGRAPEAASDEEICNGAESDYETPARRGGNPRRLSRKGKAVARALGKL